MKLIPIDTHHVAHPFQEKMLEKLWEPITIAGITVKNRISFAPTGVGTAEVFSRTDDTILLHEAIAKGGTGIIVVGEASVTPNPEMRPQTPRPVNMIVVRREVPATAVYKGLWTDEAIPAWTKYIDACHKWGAKIFPQLSSHAPWITIVSKVQGGGKTKLVVPSWQETGMTPEKLEEEKWNFVAAAVRAKKAGADGVQCHGTRESLAAILVSEMRNPGVPGYSEGLKGRVRFPTECIREIKKACGKDFPVMQRLSGTEYFPGGYDFEYSKLVAREYAEAGVDAIDVAQAGFTTEVPQLQMVTPPGSYAYLARAVKSYLTSLGPPYSEVVILNTCAIQNPWLAASMLRDGDCDMVSMCRQLYCDPDWANKIKEGRIDDIIPCIRCEWCHRHRFCTINTQFIFEKSPEQIEALKMTRADKVKKVLVAGGGAAGMEAARALALRGHKVILCEKEEELGRMLHVQSRAPFRTDVDLVRLYLSTQIKKLGVDVRCNQTVTAALVKKEKPDTVVVATGCRPELPEIPGINKHKNVVFADDVLLENVDVGKKVVVIDADVGHDVASLGSFAAQFVARAACVRDDIVMHLARWSPYTPEKIVALSTTPVGREVTIVTKRGRIADVETFHYTTMGDLRRMGVNVIVGCEYKEINEKGLVLVWGRDKKEQLLEADTIITANFESNNKLYKELEGKVPELHLIGDARAVRLELAVATQEAYRLALTI